MLRHWLIEERFTDLRSARRLVSTQTFTTINIDLTLSSDPYDSILHQVNNNTEVDAVFEDDAEESTEREEIAALDSDDDVTDELYNVLDAIDADTAQPPPTTTPELAGSDASGIAPAVQVATNNTNNLPSNPVPATRYSTRKRSRAYVDQYFERVVECACGCGDTGEQRWMMVCGTCKSRSRSVLPRCYSGFECGCNSTTNTSAVTPLDADAVTSM